MTMEPFFFDAGARRLFAIYHPPATSRASELAVVIASPFGQEHIRAHRSLLQLARYLSGLGFHAFRFDWSGSGDSSGSSDEVSLARWREDLVAAVAEMAGGLGGIPAVVIGLRLGGSVAALAARDVPDLAGLVLWAPVIDGAEYLDELDARHRDYLAGTFAKGALRRAAGREVLGFPVTDEFARELQALRVRGADLPPALPLLLAASAELPDAPATTARLASEEGPFWLKHEESLAGTLVPLRTITAIGTWLQERFP